jgi:3-deoxy-manno-octulosonate cytidylyltransferase (CMP-KDO synthetase)
VEYAEQNPEQEVIIIIPARFQSTRLPGKMLLPIADKPLILWTLESAKQAKNISRVIVATDDRKIFKIVESNGGEAMMTSKTHQSGTDRLAEVAETLAPNSIIVNVQGDEPLIPAGTIETAVSAFIDDQSIGIATTCEKIENYHDVLNPDIVKVVRDTKENALYFSRSPIPFPRDAVKKYGSLENALKTEPELLANFCKHTGLYVYRRELLLNYKQIPQTNLELLESLEQLRALENRIKIKAVEVSESSIGVDTIEDLEKVKQIILEKKRLI